MDSMQNAFRIAELVKKRLEGKLSDEEHIVLEEWKHQKEENLLLYHRIAQNPEKQYFKRVADREKSRKEEVWKRVRKDIHHKRNKGMVRSVLKYAAVFLVVVGAGFLLNQHISKQSSSEAMAILPGKNQALLITGGGEKIALDRPIQFSENGVDINNTTKELVYQKKILGESRKKEVFNTILVPRGGEYKLTLADGTRIWLNSKSKLKYPAEFEGKYRKVALEGEAFFQVARDTMHPFIVQMDNCKVEVLGTSFNVAAYEEEKEVVTTLVEGKVRFRDEKAKQASYLAPGEQLRLEKGNSVIRKQRVDPRLYTAWKDGRFVFENESLGNIMQRLARWYNVEVFFLNKGVKTLRFSGDVPRYENIDEILEMIEITQKVRFSIKNKSIMVEDRT